MAETDSEAELVHLTDCADNAEAGLLQSLLESEGIFSSLAGAFHRARVGTHILVRRGDLLRARELLAKRERDELALGTSKGASSRDSEDADEKGPNRRRRRKIAALLILVTPLAAVVGAPLFPVLKTMFRIGWVETDRPQFRIRFPASPKETTSKMLGEDGNDHEVDRFFSVDRDSGCSYGFALELGVADRSKAAEWLDEESSRARRRLHVSAPIRAIRTQGFPARDFSETSIWKNGANVGIHARWIATPAGIAVLMVICPSVALARSAKAFFSSLELESSR